MKLILTLILGILITGCGDRNNPHLYKDVVTLETYSVPAGLESEVQSALGGLLKMDQQAGKVRSLPGGQILVAASPNFQSGVKKLIEKLETQPRVEESNVRVSVWYVAGKESSTLQVPKVLKSVESNLRSVFESQGFGDFMLVEQVENIGRNGQFVKSAGTFMRLENTTRIYKDRSHLMIDVRSPYDKVQSNFLINPGETLILGKMGFPQGRDPDIEVLKKYLGDFVSDQDLPKVSFFYLVRVSKMK